MEAALVSWGVPMELPQSVNPTSLETDYITVTAATLAGLPGILLFITACEHETPCICPQPPLNGESGSCLPTMVILLLIRCVVTCASGLDNR